MKLAGPVAACSLAVVAISMVADVFSDKSICSFWGSSLENKPLENKKSVVSSKVFNASSNRWFEVQHIRRQPGEGIDQ